MAQDGKEKAGAIAEEEEEISKESSGADSLQPLWGWYDQVSNDPVLFPALIFCCTLLVAVFAIIGPGKLVGSSVPEKEVRLFDAFDEARAERLCQCTNPRQRVNVELCGYHRAEDVIPWCYVSSQCPGAVPLASKAAAGTPNLYWKPCDEGLESARPVVSTDGLQMIRDVFSPTLPDKVCRYARRSVLSYS